LKKSSQVLFKHAKTGGSSSQSRGWRSAATNIR
jgi:hypothetical protein